MSSKGGDAPKPPDTTALAGASEKQAQLWADVSREQLAWAKETDTANRDILNKVLGVQLPQLDAAFQNAQEDRARYKDTFQPIEDSLVKEFQTYDTQDRREQEASKRIADVRTSFEAQRTNATRQLEDYGIDPSQTRYQALDLGVRAQEAAASALAANQGRTQVEETGRALRGEAINIGRGYPAQVAQSQGIVNQTAGGALSGAAGVTNAGVGAFGTALGAGQLANNGYGTAANIYNTGYQNSLAGYQANNAGAAGLWGGLGSLVGNLGGSYLSNPKAFGADGGVVPQELSAIPTSSEDTVHAMLAKDEYVIPADVVKRKGTEFFDKLLAKFKDGGDYDQQRIEDEKAQKAAAIPTQEQLHGMARFRDGGYVREALGKY
jgi:hypothetical protein